MRARCVLEGVLNSSRYQDPDYMAIGANNTAQNLLEFIIEYSAYKGEEYLGPEGIAHAWELEVAKMGCKGQDAGMWALSIAANVLQRPVMSWFPIVNDPVHSTSRLHCHRLFVPFAAENRTRTPAIIMWTQSHAASPSYDHFVPVVR